MEPLTPVELVKHLGRDNTRLVIAYLKQVYTQKVEESIKAEDDASSLRAIYKAKEINKMIIDLNSAMEYKK